MAWNSALDRLLLQQVHLAEQGKARPRDVEQQIRDLQTLDPNRGESSFHLGYAQVLLGIDPPRPLPGGDAARWYLFGRLRGHERRGEAQRVADLLHDDRALLEVLGEPQIAGQCVPLVMRSLFWAGKLALAVRAVEYLAAGDGDAQSAALVDASLTDLLARFEQREGRADESIVLLLERCLSLPAFGRLADDVRARYRVALARERLIASDFTQAGEQLQQALQLAARAPLVASRARALLALAELRLHGVDELEPRRQRERREASSAWLAELDPARAATGDIAPEALFCRGILDYEAGDFATAEAAFHGVLEALRRMTGVAEPLRHRAGFFLAASILAGGNRAEASRALRLMEETLPHVRPDLESFYPVHEALKELDRRVALAFLDAVDVGRGTAPDQLLFVALEYLSLGEAAPAKAAADRVLQNALNLDQRIEAMRVLLSVHNMQGEPQAATECFQSIRDLLMQRGAFAELEKLLQNEEFVGQALDHLEIKCELVALYEEMEDRDYEKAILQTQIARSLRARRDAEALQVARGILREVEIQFPDLASEDLQAIEKLLELADEPSERFEAGPAAVRQLAQQLGRPPRILVVGGNERQRRHHPRLASLADDWGFCAEWLMANYTSPQKLVNTIRERLDSGLDLLVLLHWNRHETTEPALELARKEGVPARTVHYAGFTSLQVALADLLEKLSTERGKAKTRR
jgi:hypothetical protein